MPAATPLTPQDVADAVNALGVTKEEFTAFLAGAALLAERNTVLARIAQARAAADKAQQQAAADLQTLNSELAAVDAKYNAQFGV